MFIMICFECQCFTQKSREIHNSTHAFQQLEHNWTWSATWDSLIPLLPFSIPPTVFIFFQTKRVKHISRNSSSGILNLTISGYIFFTLRANNCFYRWHSHFLYVTISAITCPKSPQTHFPRGERDLFPYGSVHSPHQIQSSSSQSIWHHLLR